MNRPVIRVGPPRGEDHEFGEDWEVPDALVVVCSECGPITDWREAAARPHLQRAAFQHAQHAHDGDVDSEGWT